MRDRLIELLSVDMSGSEGGYADEMADYLLENGVIVPPCKVWDVVYQYSKKHTPCTPYDYTPRHIDDSECLGCCADCDSTSYDYLYEGTVNEIKLTDSIKVRVNWKEKWDNSAYEIGKTVFLTKEEAEKALKERERG